MKRILLFCLFLSLESYSFAQNTFPTTGGVGIGTLNPVMALDVNGDANIGNIDSRHHVRISSSVYPEIRFKTPLDHEVIRLGVGVGDVSSVFPIDDGDFYIYTDFTKTMPFIVKKNGNVNLVNTTGAVGVGLKNPSYKLSVAQDISMSQDIDAAQIGISGATDESKRLVLGYDVNGAGFGFIKAGWYHHQWTNLALQPNGGNVGIGTTNPTEKLAVNGNVRAIEIRVEASNWPDYVFDQDYKILELNELEAYIKEHKHLPEMPSAKEVEANGVALGELVKLQQKKIEELTLHLIEKDKALKKNMEKSEQIESNMNIVFKRLSLIEKKIEK